MSFLKSAFGLAKSVGTIVVTAVNEKANQARELTSEYEELSDEKLLRIIHSEGIFSEGSTERGVAFKELRKRGYTNESINSAK